MATQQIPNITIENARLRFRNFSGNPGPYNREGDRNVCVLLDDDIVSALERDGWNVKFLKPREEGDKPQAYLQVKVTFGTRPPNIVMITSRGRTQLGENEVMTLDYADIQTADIIIRPYTYDVNGKTGISAYVKTLFVKLNEDELELKYADVPDANVPISGAQSLTMREGTDEADNPPWN